jgi:hypothetical protein
MHFLAHPPKLHASDSTGEQTLCTTVTKIQDISVCEDRIDFSSCVIWSLLSSNFCDHFGSLEFEKYWGQRGCKVIIFHYFIFFKGNVCNTPTGLLPNHENVSIIRGDMWGEKCFNCVYKLLTKQITTTKSQFYHYLSVHF